MVRIAKSLLRALMPTPAAPGLDRFSYRWLKFWACLGAAIAFAVLLAGAIAVLEGRHGYGTALEWSGPFLVALLMWRLLGWAWMYYTLGLAPWSYEHLRIWWRVTCDSDPNRNR